MLIFNNFLLHLKKNQRLFLSLEKVTSYYYIYYYSRFDDLIKSLNSLIFGLFSNMRSDQQISAQFQTDEISIFLNNVRREKWQFNVVNRTIFYLIIKDIQNIQIIKDKTKDAFLNKRLCFRMQHSLLKQWTLRSSIYWIFFKNFELIILNFEFNNFLYIFKLSKIKCA